MNLFTSAISRVVGAGRISDFSKERAVYAEIGRIVGIPFSVANVYERFAGQVAKIIPFDLIVITHVDWDRDLVKLMYGMGLELVGLSEGDTISFQESVVAEVAHAKKAIRTDQHKYSGSLGQSLSDSGLSSRIATPLIANDKVVGTLHLASSLVDVYGEAELARLETVGNQIAGAIASAILLQAERDRASQLESLYEVAATVAQPLSFEAKAQKIVDTLALVAGADRVSLRRGDGEYDDLILVASAGPKSMGFQQSLKITDTNPATRDAFLKGEGININDYGLFPHAQPELLAQGVASMYFLPIKSGNRTLGSISVASKTTNHFDDNHIAIIRAFSNEIWSLFNSADQAEKLQRSQEAALENERRNTRMHNGLYQISRIFAEASDFNGKAASALEILVNLAGADWATLRITKDPKSGFHLAAACGLAASEYPPVPVVTEADGLKYEAFTQGKLTVIDDYPAWSGATRSLIDSGMRSLVILPIKFNEKNMGAVSVIAKKKGAFKPEMVELLTSVVEGLGNLIEISTLQDATEIAHREMERLAEELSRSNQDLEDRVTSRTEELEAVRELAMRGERFATIGQLSAGMAHDLRNPLGAIRNATYLLRRELASDGALDSNPKLNNFLDLIEKQVTRSNESITELMDFAKPKAMTLTKTSLNEVLEQALETITKLENITFVQKIDSDIQPVMADGEQLQRVFLNLVNNAQEAMIDGGSLTITAKNVDDMVEITFSDTGGGISEEDLDKIYDPLFTTKVKGTGLGLAVCLEIIERHGGMISARLGEGSNGGTTFDVKIPAYHSNGGLINVL